MENLPVNQLLDSEHDLAADLPPSLLDDFSTQQEQTLAKWDSLGDDQPFIGTPESSREDPEKLEKRLRAELLDAGENFSQYERRAYGYVYDGISSTGYRSLADSVGELGNHTARLDQKRTEGLADFIDAKFSTDPKVARSAEDLWQQYRKDSVDRANILSDTLNGARRCIYVSENARLENAAGQLSGMNSLPDEQIHLLQAYRAYFDQPSEQNKLILDETCNRYIKSVRGNLFYLAESLEPALPRSSDLPDAIGGHLSQVVARGYEDVHDAILKYFDFKSQNAPIATEPAENTPVAESPTSSEKSEAFERGYTTVWDLIK